MPSNEDRWGGLARRAIVALQDHGVAVDPSPIGCGVYGCAYGLQDDPSLVVKITSDEAEALASQLAAMSPGVPGLARIQCVYGFESLPLFAVMQERLYPLGDEAATFLGPHFPQGAARIVQEPGWRFSSEVTDLIFEAQRALGRAAVRALGDLLVGVEWLHANHLGAATPTIADILEDDRGMWKMVDLGPRGVIPALLPRDLAVRIPVVPAGG